MRFDWLVMGALVGLLAPTAAAVQSNDVTVVATSARVEIERILAADNLDTDTLASRVVADAMARIKRGRAPDDFWRAYQAHLAAWHHLADAEDRARKKRDNPTGMNWAADLAYAERRIATTFDDVERIARRYGARLPVPRPFVKSAV